MCFQVYMRPPLPRDNHGSRLKVVMVESLSFVCHNGLCNLFCDQRKQQHSYKRLVGCRVDLDVSLSTFYHNFFVMESSMTGQSKTRNVKHLLLKSLDQGSPARTIS